MPRKPRVEYAGAVYHVMSRGNHSQKGFRTDDDCETGEYANNGQTVTFPLAADFSAMMLSSMTDADMRMIPVTDLRAWYISAYLDGTAPESGKIVFAYDVSQEDAAFDFWFITVRIALNDAGEIAYMEYEYVPWG